MTFNMPFSTWRSTRKSFSIHWTRGIGQGPLPLSKAFSFWPGIKVKSVKTKIWPWVNHKYYITVWKGRADFMNIVLLWFLVFHNKKHNISLVFISDIRHRWNIAFMLHEIWSHPRGSAGHQGEINSQTDLVLFVWSHCNIYIINKYLSLMTWKG